MTLTDTLLGILALSLMLFLAGWLVAMRGQKEMEQAAYEGGKRLQRAADLARLVRLRQALEEDENGLATTDAYLLYDVCAALRLTDGEAQHVIGAAYWMVVEAPIAAPEVRDERGE